MCSRPRPITCIIDRQATIQWQASFDFFNHLDRQVQSENGERNTQKRPTLLLSMEHDDTLGVFNFRFPPQKKKLISVVLRSLGCSFQLASGFATEILQSLWNTTQQTLHQSLAKSWTWGRVSMVVWKLATSMNPTVVFCVHCHHINDKWYEFLSHDRLGQTLSLR